MRHARFALTVVILAALARGGTWCTSTASERHDPVAFEEVVP